MNIYAYQHQDSDGIIRTVLVRKKLGDSVVIEDKEFAFKSKLEFKAGHFIIQDANMDFWTNILPGYMENKKSAEDRLWDRLVKIAKKDTFWGCHDVEPDFTSWRCIIPIIKAYRTLRGVGLKDAKDKVEEIFYKRGIRRSHVR